MNFGPPQMFGKRQLTSSASPDFRPQTPKRKRRMQRSSEISSGHVKPMDMRFVDQKIAEVEYLLTELYNLRDYFEQKNSKTREIPSYYA